MEGGARISGTYTTFGVAGLLSSAAAGGVGCRVTWLEGLGPATAAVHFLVPWAWLQSRGGFMCAASTAATRFSGLWDSVTSAGEPGL